MRNIERILGNYWIGYYLVYLVAVLVLMYRHDWTLAQWDDVELMSDIFSTVVGYALLAAVVVEGLGRMVLLIPKTVKAIMAKGHAEGHAEGLTEGRTEGRKKEQKRMLSALREARARGIDPDSPEFERFLRDFQVDGTEDVR